MVNFFAELKRRNIYRVGAAYAVVAWVLLQLFNNVAPILESPPWFARVLLLFLVLGFPAAAVVAWIYEGRSATPGSTKTNTIDWVLAAALLIVIVLVSYQQIAPSSVGNTASVRATTSQVDAISIAVLPFANMSGDAGQEFFSDGMTEEINTALAKVRDIHVVARTSAFQFKGRNTDVQAIAQQLHATHVIEGSVRKAGDRVRVTAELIRADSGLQLWSENYDRNLTDIFAIQENIAQAIAGALRVSLGLVQGDTLVHDRTANLESYDQYLRAKTLMRTRGSLQAVTDAATLLESVVARDPSFAAAWALLAQAYLLVPGYSPRDAAIEDTRRVVRTSFDNVERAAAEAIKLDPLSAVAYAALARTRKYQGKWADADDLTKRALTLDPGEPEALNDYIVTLSSMGRNKEALAAAEKLHLLEPSISIYTAALANQMQINGHSDETIHILNALPSDRNAGNILLAEAYASQGRYGQAADALLLDNRTLFSRENVEAAARLLRALPLVEDTPDSLPAFGYPLHFVYAYVNALPRVLEANETALASGYYVGSTGLWLPVYAPLRKTERFKNLMRNMGLVDYWKARGWPDLCRPVGADDFVCD